MIDNILVIDDVISKEKQDLLENLLINNPDFPWYFIKHLGFFFVNGFNLVPFPAAKIIKII